MEYQKTMRYFKLFQIVLINYQNDKSQTYQNGKSQTHCLAVILTKTPNLNEDLQYKTFRCLKKEEMTILINDSYAENY